MNEVATPMTAMDNQKEFRVSRRIGDKEITLSGEKVMNGWIITIRKEWRDPPKEGQEYGQWHDDVKKYISKESPLKKAQEKEMDDMTDMLQKTMSMFGDIVV